MASGLCRSFFQKSASIIIIMMVITLIPRYDAVNLLLCIRDSGAPVLELSTGNTCSCSPAVASSHSPSHDLTFLLDWQDSSDHCEDMLLTLKLPALVDQAWTGLAMSECGTMELSHIERSLSDFGGSPPLTGDYGLFIPPGDNCVWPLCQAGGTLLLN